MKLGSRMWNLPWEPQAQPFVFPHLSWVGSILDVMQRTDAKMCLLNLSLQSQGRSGIPGSCEHPGKTVSRVTNDCQAWHQLWFLLKWLVGFLSLWASLLGMNRSFCYQCPLSWELLWAWDFFSIHPDMTLSLKNKPYCCFSIGTEAVLWSTAGSACNCGSAVTGLLLWQRSGHSGPGLMAILFLKALAIFAAAKYRF